MMIILKPENMKTTDPVDLSPVSQEELEKLLSQVTDGVDETTASTIATRASAATPEQVELLWRKLASVLGRYFQGRYFQEHNSLEGLNPQITRLSKHFQALLAEAFAARRWGRGESSPTDSGLQIVKTA